MDLPQDKAPLRRSGKPELVRQALDNALIDYEIALGLAAFCHWAKPYPKYLVQHHAPNRRARRAAAKARRRSR